MASMFIITTILLSRMIPKHVLVHGLQVLAVMNIMEVMCNASKAFWRTNFTCGNRYNAADVGECTVVHIISVGQATRDQGALQ